MVSTRLDMSVFASLMSLGGMDLRNQLLVDLQRFEAELSSYCLSRPEDLFKTEQQLSSVLHNLRGLAATIGAESLVETCQEPDSSSDQRDHVAQLRRIARVIEEISATRAQIQRNGGLTQ